jgi:BirA family biotin operon repressor/biotin-[acetyl-CoA-carboxylase] ligase
MDTTSQCILSLLYDREEGFVSLDELAAAARIGRASVDAAVARLRSAGQRLEFSPSAGVRLIRPVRLEASLIERGLNTRRVGRSVICFEQVSSTNEVALEAIRQADTDGLVVLAESQSAGRGRGGRRWVSPPGKNLLLSALLLDPSGAAAAAEALTIAAGVAVAEAVDRTTGLACELKWPNDVLLDGRKVAGVLVETRHAAKATGVVVGVGVNVNAAPDAGDVAGPATSLAERLGHPVERVELARALLTALDGWVERIADGRLGPLRDGFVARCRMINERATIRCRGRQHTGRVLDVDPMEGLSLCDDDGRCVYLPAEGSTVVG